MKKVMIVCGLFLAGASAFAWSDYNYQDYQVNSYSNVDYTPDYRVCAVAITRDLRMGSQNSEVTVLQDYLHDSNYMDVSPNGYFGSATRKAVILFQRDKGITPTGTVGVATRQELNDAICNVDDTFGYVGSTYGLPAVSHTTQIPTTYVSSVDPFVQRQVSIQSSNFAPVPTVLSTPSITSYTPTPTFNNNALFPTQISSIVPASSQIQSTTIVHNPGTGYTIGIIPQSSSITISSPLANAVYREGDTINLAWTSSNINITGYNILLENISTGLSKLVVNTQELPSSNGHITSFVLTKELLDSVCSVICNSNQQGAFRIVIATPVTDIAGTTSTFRATVSSITITRPPVFSATVLLTTSKTPVNSDEAFRLYTNIPTGGALDPSVYNQFSFRVHAICPSSMTVNIAGTQCGADLTIPYTASFYQQEIPVKAVNNSWYKQDVIFEMIVTNLNGQIVDTSRATVTVNPAPFSW